MTQNRKKGSDRKPYAKPGLINYGDLSVLTTGNDPTKNTQDAVTKGGMNLKTGSLGDPVDQSFERFDGSSDYSRRGGSSGGEGAGRGG